MLYKEILKFLGYVGLVLLIVNIFNINPNFRLDKENEILNKKIDSLQANIDSSKVKIAQLDSVATVYKQQVIEDKIKLSGLKHKADLYKELGLYEPFDLLILSYEIGMRKPHKEAYRFVEEQTGFHPKEYLFIDDKIENIQSAKHHQWNAILFCDADQLEKDLISFGFSIN